MSRAIGRRGPDDQGTWLDADLGVGLGHRRLSIIDLSPAGRQPMVSNDGRWVLVCNGEIYDHALHRDRLKAHGVTFRGTSDSEVLLAMIAERGVESTLREVDGMFALAVWDRRSQVLTLARDRLGEKPLYYGSVGGQFAFASELAAIRQLPRSPASPDPRAVAAFLEFGFVPAPQSILPGIWKLPAGCVMTVDPSGNQGEPVAYWSLGETAMRGLSRPLPLDDGELIERTDLALRTSVGRRMMSDVPIGAFLSGGLDSSTIVALAQAVSVKPVRTFTVSVGGQGDESAAAAAVARHLGTNHTELPLAQLDPLEMAQTVTKVYDEPFADPSAIPTVLLCRAAHEHVKVALSGDGADELLAGYNRYRVADGRLGRLLRVPRRLRRGLGDGLRLPSPAAWDRLGRFLRTDMPDLGTKMHKMARVLSASDALDAYGRLARQWLASDVMLEPTPVEEDRLAAEASLLPGGPLEQMLLLDQQRTLPDNMLVKVDRASMSTALEVRVPFLAHEFVELSWQLPARAKVRDGRGKWLVREVLRQYVPPELWDRPKVGFDPPLAEWLRGPLDEWAHDLLSPQRLKRQGLLRPEPVAAALGEHASGRRNLDYQLWTLLMLQSWLDLSEESK